MRQQLIDELKLRKIDLEKEIQAINTLLGEQQSYTTPKEEKTTIVNKAMLKGAKGNKTWEKYTIDLLDLVGGKGKVTDVLNRAIDLNPDVTEKRLKSALRHHLSKLSRVGAIGAIKGKGKSEGYEYYILDK